MIKTNTETVRRILAEFPNLQSEKKTLEGNHEMTYREAIRALYPTLRDMKKRGFSTKDLAEKLDEYGIKATFFVTGQNPEYFDLIYEVNYGYVPEVIGGDGEEQDAYVLGVSVPIEEFDGVVIAIIHRNDDNETKWVVAPENMDFSDEEILKTVDFQEKYFDVTVCR